jgi:hypothetical protein
MLTILVFEIKEGKNAQKVINRNLSLLIRGGYQCHVCGGIIPRKFLSIQKIKNY